MRVVPSRVSVRPGLTAILAVLAAVSCGGEGPPPAGGAGESGPALPALTLGEVEWRGPEGSAEPYLASGRDGRILLTWLEEGEAPADEPAAAGPEATLRLAERDAAAGWSDPRPVTSGTDLFVNWADFPSVTELADGTLLAHWLRKAGEGPYAYHVEIALSRDGGRTWSEPVVPHGDRSATEHGFVSVVPWRGGAALVWLDGRAMAPAADGTSGAAGAAAAGDAGGGTGAPAGDAATPPADMQLRAVTVAADGSLGEERLLDRRTCECCATALATTPAGLVAAYRDRSPEEVRDIAAVRTTAPSGAPRPSDAAGSGGGPGPKASGAERTGREAAGAPAFPAPFTEPSLVHADGWEIGGCPVNGPQLSSAGERLAVAWFTAEGGAPRVLAAFSEDAGASWGDPVRVDEGRPVGRVDVELLPDGTAAVSWIEAAGERPAVRLRRVAADGRLGPSAVVSPTGGDRASGFPRLAPSGDGVLVAWTLTGPGGGVRVRAAR